MYLFYNFCTSLHVSSDHFVHHQEFMIYCALQPCTNHANVRLHGLYFGMVSNTPTANGIIVEV